MPRRPPTLPPLPNEEGAADLLLSQAEINRRRQAELEAGRRAWDLATYTGKPTFGETQAQLERLGRASLEQGENASPWKTASPTYADAILADAEADDLRPVARGANDAKFETLVEEPPRGMGLRALWEGRHKGWLPDWVLALDTVPRTAANRITLGQADRLAAAGDAALGRVGPATFGQRYEDNLQGQISRDQYDAEHRPIATGLGNFLGDSLLAAGAGARFSSMLSPRTKGVLGEFLSETKARAVGDPVIESQVRTPLSEGYTRADWVRRSGKTIESKFGPSAKLSKRQTQAATELGDRYQVERWGPGHVALGTGPAGGAVGGVLGAPPGDAYGDRRRPQARR